MISNVNGLLTKAPAKLRNICNSGGVQGPQRVLVEGLDTFAEANFDAIRK
jgi:hypothetical protein